MSQAASDSGSSIKQISPDQREGQLLSLYGFTVASSSVEGEREIDPSLLEFTLAAYLGWRDFEERRGDILPHLPDLLKDCDFHWGLEVRDTALSPIAAAKQLMEATENATTAPFALAGSLFSSVSLQVTALASAFDIPQISGTSSSMQLELSDMFARTVPTNAQDARAVMTYYHSLGVKRVASVFMNEPYGIQYNLAVQEEANRLGIALVFFPLDKDRLDQSMQQLKASQARYVFAIVLEGDWQMVVKSAQRNQVMGHPDYTWLVPDLTYLKNPRFGLDKETESGLALAMHGLGIFSGQTGTTAQAFDTAFRELPRNATQLQDFISRTAYPEMFANFSFKGDGAPFLYHHLVYDSTIALGLAACSTPGLFRGRELFEKLLQTEFEGLSGVVSFDPRTGNRAAVTTQYRVDNLLLSESRTTDTEYKLDAAECTWIKGDEVYELWPFVYANNSTEPPLDLPPIENYNYNLIPKSLQVVGYCMGAGVIFLSMCLLIWTYMNRKTFIVSSAQPVFLYELCIGCVIMASAIFPLSMQGKETSPTLDKACMSTPWLLLLGCVTAMSAILAKAWRLEQLLDGAQALRRVKVRAVDVIKPFIILMVWNVAMLIGWTVVSPLKYVRTENNDFDEFGRSVESYGRCESTNNWSFLFVGLAFAANICGVVFTAYKCYKVRNATAHFSETNHLVWSAASLVETTLLGAPIILAARDRPPALFVVSSALICACCLAFLLPVFVFKLRHQDSTYRDARFDSQVRRGVSIGNSLSFQPGRLRFRRPDEKQPGVTSVTKTSTDISAVASKSVTE